MFASVCEIARVCVCGMNIETNPAKLSLVKMKFRRDKNIDHYPLLRLFYNTDLEITRAEMTSSELKPEL